MSALSLQAQVATGTPPLGSFAGGPDVIDLANLNVHWDFPIIAKAGRGLPFHYSLGFDNSVWQVVDDGNGNLSWHPMNNVFGWTRQTEAIAGYMTYDQLLNLGCGYTYQNWVYHDPAGTAHSFGNLYVATAGCSAYGPPVASATATDGSGYLTTVSSNPNATIYPASGGSIVPPLQNATGAAQITDPNGNYIISSDGVTFYDTMGIWQMTIANQGAPYPTSYTVRIPGGSSAATNISYTTYNVQTNFGCSGITEYGPTSVPLISTITYPDGSSYQFTYEPTPGNTGNTTGRLASVTLPAGGVISYNYWGGGGGLNGIFCDGTTAAIGRTGPDGQSSYVVAENGNGATTTQVNTYTPWPQYDATLINFSNGIETQRQVYQGPAPPTTGGTLLETIETCYNGASRPCVSQSTPSFPLTEKTVYPETTYRIAKHDLFINTYGLTTEQDDYDWTSTGAFGNPLRKTLTTYATNLGNIVSRPASVTVKDGSNNILAQTTYGYDETTPITTPLCPNPNCVPNHGPPYQTPGNLTSVHSCTAVSGGSCTNSLTKTFTYYDTGTVSTATDVNNAVTTYNYPSPDPNNSTCGFAFPTSVNPPTVNSITLTTSTTWDCYGGVAASTTDANNNTRSVTLDSLWRPTAIKDELGYQTNISYTHATTSNPAVVESTFTFNSNNSTIDTRTTLDGLGRAHVVQQKQSPTATNYDSAETDYDFYGRPSESTIAYVGTAGQNYCASLGLPSNCTPPGTSTTYDALSRPTQTTDAGNGTANYFYYDNNVLIKAGPAPTTPVTENPKQRQYEYDALGRLVSVCELTSTANGGGNCAQNTTPRTGYWTTYAYDAADHLLTVTQNTQATGSHQARSFSYDLLGRMLSETNPESGTTSYAYDSPASVCNTTSPGDIVQKGEANGVATCYSHDALHRQTILGHYYNGSLISASFFIFDSATVNGISVANPKGRMTGAYNCLAPCSTHLTDLVFSYSARGETTDVYESTPHSNGNYHVTAGYWPHGALKNWTMPGVPTITYGATDGSGLDGEGRLTKVTAASGQNPVTGVTYYNSGTAQPIGALTQVNFGSSDSDQFSYDTNTGRLKQYTFNVNSQTDVGQLTWNANGSLQKLQTTDGITGAQDTQTCTYSHDDLGRIASVDCGSGNWGQNFGYDPFGNITKTIPSGRTGQPFQAAYNLSNRITTSGFVYDGGANSIGNLTSDTIHTYSWNADDQMSSVTTGSNTVNLTYDALGRMVEQQRGTAYQQIVYSPGGNKLALMNGQTLTKAFVPLPGGATAVYNASGLQYYRHSDHLGSSRLASTSTRGLYYSGAYAPFGESYKETGTTDRSFTGNNEDTVTGTADFMYREYSSNQQGRWISPDPAGLAAVDPANPQSWNRYAYVMNNPLLFTDLLGLVCSPDTPCHIDLPPLVWNPITSDIVPVRVGFSGSDSGSFFLAGGWGGSGSSSSSDLEAPPAGDDSGGGGGGGCTGCDDHPGLRAFYNNPDCQNCGSLLHSARDFTQAIGVATFAVPVGVVGIYTIASAGTMDVAVGSVRALGQESLHIAYGTGGQWVHAVGRVGVMIVTSHALDEFLENSYQFKVPVLNPEAIIPELGSAAYNCFTSTCSAFFRGLKPW
ncbi:MAG TPA: RHS repeat-associated core domain-containing protein [Terriglobales bacterium]|nr:RHS repeat-associated core domain-containing protein [Terriglobales bacterium]